MDALLIGGDYSSRQTSNHGEQPSSHEVAAWNACLASAPKPEDEGDKGGQKSEPHKSGGGGSWFDRGLGILQAGVGVLETAGGVVGGVLTSETGIGAVAGGAVALHGLDDIQAGLRQAISGKPTQTLTQQAASGLARDAGANPQLAMVVGMGVDIAAGGGFGGPEKAAVAGLEDGTKVVEDGTKVGEDAAKLGKDGETGEKVATAGEKGEAGLRTEVRNGYTYTIDGEGRTTEVEGELTANPAQGRNPKAQLAAGGDDRLPTDEGGHFVGRRFDGPMDDFNHFAQDMNLNRGAYKSLENSWQRALDKGQSVSVDITAHYPGNSLRPSSLDVTYTIDGVPYQKSFLNRPGG
jgi:hypothetical protein